VKNIKHNLTFAKKIKFTKSEQQHNGYMNLLKNLLRNKKVKFEVIKI
jgi:hypothetical protein